MIIVLTADLDVTEFRVFLPNDKGIEIFFSLRIKVAIVYKMETINLYLVSL